MVLVALQEGLFDGARDWRWPLFDELLAMAIATMVAVSRWRAGYRDFLKLHFSAYSGFCRGTDCLVLPTWNHPWFLPYLFFYTALLVLLRRVLPAR